MVSIRNGKAREGAFDASQSCLNLYWKISDYFFSYQCEPDETPDPERLGQSAVVFFDNYRPSGDLACFEKEILCPLNGKEDISGTCVNCRRCFNGDAVRYEKMS